MCIQYIQGIITVYNQTLCRCTAKVSMRMSVKKVSGRNIKTIGNAVKWSVALPLFEAFRTIYSLIDDFFLFALFSKVSSEKKMEYLILHANFQ